MNQPRVFELLIQNYNGMSEEYRAEVPLHNYLAEEVDNFSQVRQGLIQCRTDALDLEADYKKQKASIDQRQRNLRARCLHLETTYNPDPSGNNDSWTECNLCGAEV